MAVACKKCGGSHPTWDCTASAAKIAAYEASKAASAVASDPKQGHPAEVSPKPRVVKAARSHETAKGAPAKATKSSGGSSEVERQPSKLGVVGSIPTRRSNERLDDLGSVQDGRKMSMDGRRSGGAATAGDEPTQVVPAAKPKRGRGRPPSIADMAAYKAQKQREYRERARLKAEKEGKS